jgi:hypothetical protein
MFWAMCTLPLSLKTLEICNTAALKEQFLTSKRLPRPRLEQNFAKTKAPGYKAPNNGPHIGMCGFSHALHATSQTNIF